MNVLKTTKMISKILMFMLLAYFLVNLSTARPQEDKPNLWGLKNTPAQYKKASVHNQPIKIHPSVFGNFKGNPVVPYKVTAPYAPSPSPAKPLAPLTTPPAAKFRPSIIKENENHQGFGTVEDEDDDYEEEEEEEEKEGEEEEDLESSKTVRSQPILSSSTSKPPTVPENVNQEKDNNQGFGTVENEDDDYEEEEEEEKEGEEEEEDLESSKTVSSQPILSSSTSKPPTVPENVNQEKDNHQGFGTVEDEGDNYEEEGEEEEEEEKEEEEDLENSKTVTSPPILSSSTSKPPTVPENVNQENINYQGFKTLEGGDDEELSEENEYGHNVEEHSEDPNHNTPIDYITINGKTIPINNFISTAPQSSEDELTENNYNESEYPLNTDEDNQVYYYSDEMEPESSNYSDNPTEISETLNRQNDNTKDQSINTNEFELNSYDNTQISTEKQEDAKEDQFENQYVTENKEGIINGYKALKKILYMLQDYASSTFNWIINKIDYRMEQVSS